MCVQFRIDPAVRRSLITKPVVIKRKAWIGTVAAVSPVVTVGENSVIAAGAVLTEDVPGNTVVGSIAAKVVKKLNV